MTTSPRRRAASNSHASFKPQLEVLEGRDLLSLWGVGQALSHAASDVGAIVVDGASYLKDEVKLFIDQAVDHVIENSTSIRQDQKAVERDKQALARDATGLGNDLSNLWQNIIHPLTDVPLTAPASPPASPPPASPPPSATSVVGTFSITVKPTTTGGDVDPDTPQNVTVTLKADGSGTLNISPFAGTTQTFNFPAGTATLFDGGSKVSLSYTSAPYKISFLLSLSADGNVLGGDVDVYNTANFDEAYFYPIHLYRQASSGTGGTNGNNATGSRLTFSSSIHSASASRSTGEGMFVSKGSLTVS